MPLQTVLLVLAVPVLLAASYLSLLTALSFARDAPAPREPRLRLDVIVPAHDEEGGVAAAVRGLLAQDWPRAKFRVIVVADNCADATAARAAEAGATVWVREDRERRGKGYALAYAFQRSLGEGVADAVVVVDADCAASPNLLAALAARLDAGSLAAQSRNAVSNGDASWRTRLLALAFVLFNEIRSLGRERLGVSCGLRGTGMCISHEALRRVPYEAFSVVEDLEYGIRLGEAGIRVAYAHEGHVSSPMVVGERASRSQRRRWEAGRMRLMWRRGPGLLVEAVRRRDPLLLDLAADVLVPPLSWLAACSAAGLAACLALPWPRGTPPPALWCFAAATALLAAHVLRGWQASGQGIGLLPALLYAPFFLAWKILVLATGPGRGSTEFIRTERKGP